MGTEQTDMSSKAEKYRSDLVPNLVSDASKATAPVNIGIFTPYSFIVLKTEINIFRVYFSVLSQLHGWLYVMMSRIFVHVWQWMQLLCFSFISNPRF